MHLSFSKAQRRGVCFVCFILMHRGASQDNTLCRCIRTCERLRLAWEMQMKAARRALFGVAVACKPELVENNLAGDLIWCVLVLVHNGCGFTHFSGAVLCASDTERRNEIRWALERRPLTPQCSGGGVGLCLV